MLKQSMILLLTLFFSLNVLAVDVDPIDRELSDMYKLYLARLSDPAVETIMTIKPMIEFYDDEAESLLDSLTMNVRRLFPGLKSGDMFVIIYMAVYETLVAEDDLYVYPSLAEYNKNIFNLKKRQAEFERLSALMKEYKGRTDLVLDDNINDDNIHVFTNIYYDFSLAQGELDAVKEMGKKIKFRYELNLQRRNMLQQALRECLSRLLMDELGL